MSRISEKQLTAYLVEEQAQYKVTVPGVEADRDLAQKVNQEIQTIVDGHIAEMQAMWAGYH